jgi:hypothetical protein
LVEDLVDDTEYWYLYQNGVSCLWYFSEIPIMAYAQNAQKKELYICENVYVVEDYTSGMEGEKMVAVTSFILLENYCVIF